jgi:hypothetical protein
MGDDTGEIMLPGGRQQGGAASSSRIAALTLQNGSRLMNTCSGPTPSSGRAAAATGSSRT